jgi:hypothetical protein
MRQKRAVRCTYLVTLERDACDAEIGALAAHLSALASMQCEVIIVDRARPDVIESHRRVLRWIGRYLAVGGELDVVRTATELATSEKVIVATAEARYTFAEIDAICRLLDRYEMVEPEEFVEPATWWGGIEAGRLLLHRGVDQPAAHSTFAFRKSAFQSGPISQLLDQRAAVFLAHDVFVRREPPLLTSWMRLRPRDAASDFALPFKTAFFLSLIPLLLFVALAGGLTLAAESIGAMAFASVMVAVRGRSGAANYFPLAACFFAPLWIVERSVSVYWALFQRIRGVAEPAAHSASPRQLAEKACRASDSLS